MSRLSLLNSELFFERRDLMHFRRAGDVSPLISRAAENELSPEARLLEEAGLLFGDVTLCRSPETAPTGD